MSNQAVYNNEKYLTPRKIVTKRDLIRMLYTQFQAEINKIVNLSHIFPSIDEIDIGDLCFTLTYLFPDACNTKHTLYELILIQNIQISNEKIVEILPIVDNFLIRFRSI